MKLISNCIIQDVKSKTFAWTYHDFSHKTLSVAFKWKHNKC